MKTSIKLLFGLVLLFSTISFSSNAQYLYSYEYDNAGNRTFRTQVELLESPGDSLMAHLASDSTALNAFNEEQEALGVQEDIGDNMISIYPNPFLSEINISFKESGEEIKEVRLFSSVGKIIYSAKDVGEDLTIPLEGRPSGTYFLWIDTTLGKRDYKLVKH